MKINLFTRSFALALVMAFASFGAALTHGEATITVEPTVAVPGGQITITGADMEDGEVFKSTLENATGIVEREPRSVVDPQAGLIRNGEQVRY